MRPQPLSVRRLTVVRAATLVWTGVVLVGSLLPPSLGGRGGPLWHLAGYGVLAVLLAAWQPPARSALLAWGYSVLVEGLQGLTSYRSAEARDVAVNAVAVGVALAVRSAWLAAGRAVRAGVWWRGRRGEWWVVGQAVLLGALAAVPPLGPQLPRAEWIVGAAVLLALVGASFLVAGARALGPALSVLPSPRPGARLVRHGIYRWVRHPIYTGVMLVAGGWAVFRGSAAHLALALAVAVFFGAKASREERWLAQHYPDYDGYRRTTRRFVPWLF